MERFFFPVIPILAPPVHLTARMDMLQSVIVLLHADQSIQAKLPGTSEISNVKVGIVLFSDKVLGPVSRKPRKLFGPVKPFLVHLYQKTEECIGIVIFPKKKIVLISQYMYVL